MGQLLYGPHRRVIEIDDRALAHLKVVVFAKLRRGESFSYSWERSAQDGSGRCSVWISPAIALEFSFFGSRPPAINRRWITELTAIAASGELTLVDEPAPSGEH